VLPANGTKCTVDYSGEKNIILVGYLANGPHSQGTSNLKLGLGLGLGLGFPIVIALIVFIGYWALVRRNQKKTFVPRPKYIPRDPPLRREENLPERLPSIRGGDWKDRSLFPE